MDDFGNSLDTFSKKIEYVERGPVDVPKMFTINLGIPLVDQIYDISGRLVKKVLDKKKRNH